MVNAPEPMLDAPPMLVDIPQTTEPVQYVLSTLRNRLHVVDVHTERVPSASDSQKRVDVSPEGVGIILRIEERRAGVANILVQREDHSEIVAHVALDGRTSASEQGLDEGMFVSISKQQSA
jgi:hypothetical protein